MANIKATSDATFDQDIQGATPVLVDFWAEWCGPCRMVAPVLEQIASEQGDKLKILKLNVDEHPAIAQRFRVMSIPTLMLFKDGRPVDQMVGFRPKPQLMERLRPHLEGMGARS
jgi:thioredoxin 1